MASAFETLHKRLEEVGAPPLPSPSPLIPPSVKKPQTEIIPLPVTYLDHLLKQIISLKEELARLRVEYAHGINDLQKRYADLIEREDHHSAVRPTGRNKR